ncbi:MAG: hypothetical protein HN855_06535 [Anaerolineae bacterium]|jgi:hypothetical protein|nr:hypothetical protein [Anaerolineae bacterium]MBT7070602.1 hypothetical protein [Anaerolineae bacterium]MBT7324795.1 hypothetical protein [Anaerolineae bacterium]
MKKKILFILLSILAIMSLAGCKPKGPPDEPEKPLPPIELDESQNPPLLPTTNCPADELSAPWGVSPDNYQVVYDSAPTLEATYDYLATTYPNPTSSDPVNCTPEQIHFYLSTGPDYLDEIGGFWPTFKWTITTPLQPGVMYRWAVAGVTNSIEGPISSYYYFFAGPICDEGEILAAIPLEPADGAIVDTLNPTFKWTVEENVSCIADTYYVHWARSDIDSVEDYFALPHSPTGTSDPLPVNLTDCRPYKWRMVSTPPGKGAGWTDSVYSEWKSFIVSLAGTKCDLVEVGSDVIKEDFLGIKNANCRSNPWNNANEVGFLPAGETASLLGVNEDASWGFFKLINERECWIHMSTVELQPPGSTFEPALYPLIAHDPVSEDTEASDPTSSCSQITDTRTCEANSACSWDSRANACKDK